MINASFEAMDTPGKKRKRENFQKFVSSTPIKTSNKENFIFSESCMEVKSIAELVAERKSSQIPVSEYEVIRKPPKKRKKAAEESCFVNPGLDLKVDEKVINPFEVVRDDYTEAKMLAKGVSNPALDIKNEAPLDTNVEASTNPFEVKRDEVEFPKSACGIENSALQLDSNNPVRAALVLPLPFTPTVNHRIDFSSMPDNLTPSSLLSTKLVLENNEAKITPIGTPKRHTAAANPGRSLSVISEEEIDIGEELDNYQLQLENSINEAKIKNRQYEYDNKVQAETEEPKEQINSETFTKETLKTIEESAKNIGLLSGLKESDVDCEEYYPDDINDDVQFEEVDSFEDVGKLGQFKRAYRTEAPSAEFKKPIIDLPTKKSSKLGGSIRRSIRKLIHKKSSAKDENEKSLENSEPKHDGIFQTIRQSLRRKQKPKVEAVVNLETTMVGRQVFRETINNEIPKRTLEKQTLKRNIVKGVKTFMESVEEFDHF